MLLYQLLNLYIKFLIFVTVFLILKSFLLLLFKSTSPFFFFIIFYSLRNVLNFPFASLNLEEWVLYNYCLITPAYETLCSPPLAHAHVILNPCELGVLVLHYVLLMSLQKCLCVSLWDLILNYFSPESLNFLLAGYWGHY